jgi:hypothetical protein
VQAKTTVSAHRRSDPNPVIAAAMPVSQAPSRRPVRSNPASAVVSNAYWQVRELGWGINRSENRCIRVWKPADLSATVGRNQSLHTPMSDRLPTIRVFISSPADVRPERLRAEQIIARLDREFAYHFHVEAVLWEREPLVATHHFQDPDNIPEPHGSDIVVVILWSRLGVPLPKDRFRGAISGRAVTGTEWEFEDALASARARHPRAAALPQDGADNRRS